MKSYPLMLNIKGRPVIVVGGGRVAERKVVTLLDCGAEVTVISPEILPELQELAERGGIAWIKSPFAEWLLDQIAEPALVFGTTDRRDVNLSIYHAASKRGIPCNIADVPDLCSFTVPAVVSRGDLTIAIATGGASPALARRIREELEERVGEEYAIMTRIMGELRKLIVVPGRTTEENRELFMKMVDSDLTAALKDGNWSECVVILRAILPPDIDPEPIVREATKG